MKFPIRHPIRAVLLLALAILLLPYVLVPVYSVGHPVSLLMVGRYLTGAPVTRTWVDIEAISPALPRSVVAAEDARFCSHRGIDWGSISDILEDAEDGEVARGGSTITQQVAKNLFLWPGRSYVRKALEFPLALWIDFILPKKRILELYLNVAEWGPNGQFGAEAGARHAFGKGAGALSPHQAALLAATLPNPVTRSARAPSAHIRRLAGTYTARARSAAISACWSRNS
ncbi:monofunctional biosynthetic peptidoglycan transglycosylase [Afipia carboxidovorans OM5]|uniref:Biosynthetic peptidoglycan transglycosylase n=1 Tax=Afipia carboxidovorans (strain ATCC 49405 / DSM 1227 / KCTC 32145 / OM5) TaxID=504832 RepID=B6JA23_AFIC5|nr:monofunctional biosynthetic peptidoglycan transglycosylase [Afipia carboxidovorans]ACI91266.1 monofunctional biosynthetic peptidoglycan transglycosylase [Afipia carboxidovorans OM5]AEI01546.1 monofunctional biosynthetic peptidoglycan transglycosylase MtgA [Afipia carboxidovorans OM4]AEI05121.1 monofunctional biosynthetic peptidoglycan transglycosylase MtgA [Afipia carboxidovorans OM5]